MHIGHDPLVTIRTRTVVVGEQQEGSRDHDDRDAQHRIPVHETGFGIFYNKEKEWSLTDKPPTPLFPLETAKGVCRVSISFR